MSGTTPDIVVRREEKELSSDYRAACTALEQELAAMWRAHLKVEPVGLDDDFFELGGHSLLAAELLVAIERAVGVPVSATTLYLSPTIAELAEAIEQLHLTGDSEKVGEHAVRVTVDRERCVGSATCTVVAAGIFALDEHDRAEPQVAVVTDTDLVDQAAQLCPTGAIHLQRVHLGQ